jgi:hypothetical protein
LGRACECEKDAGAADFDSIIETRDAGGCAPKEFATIGVEGGEVGNCDIGICGAGTFNLLIGAGDVSAGEGGGCDIGDIVAVHCELRP